MFVNKKSIISDGKSITFLNRFALNDYFELMSKVMDNMLDDLSKVTGLAKDEILEDYMSLNEYSPIKEILKREGKYPEEKSMVLFVMGK